MDKELKLTDANTEKSYLIDISEIYVGCYQISSYHSHIRFNLKKKPKWLHRKFCELLLGWKWIDIKDI